MLGWLRHWRKWQQKRKGLVELTEDGFVLHRAGKAQAMTWVSVTQIDVGRTPNLVVEDFWVVLSSGTEQISLHDTLFEFKEFEKSMLSQWPEIERAWGIIHNGPPDAGEWATLWKQRERY